MASHGLIFDVGANDGRDAYFYLRKGFRVVSVEANPVLAAALRSKLLGYLLDGSLTIVNAGIWSERSTLPFYANRSNSHWSSFDRKYGTRGDLGYDVVDIGCILFADLIERYGVPYYAKIDVEGADKIILDALRPATAPAYVSIEEYGVEGFDRLASLGYSEFYIASQKDKRWAIPPHPPREGDYFDRISTGADSGLFGREIPGPWLSYAEARRLYAESVRAEDGRWMGDKEEWFDIHARRSI